MISYRITDVAKRIVAEHVKIGDRVIDATAGKGQDTLFLSELVGETGRVLAFDIQPEAIESLKALEQMHSNIRVLAKGHERIEEVDGPVRAVMFNFGYLPGGDKKKTTIAETSVKAVKASLKKLSVGGVVTLCLYPGHPEGARESRLIEKHIKTLNPSNYLVFKMDYLNGKNSPYCILIRKNKE